MFCVNKCKKFLLLNLLSLSVLFAQDWLNSNGPYSGKYELTSVNDLVFAANWSNIYLSTNSGANWEYLREFESIVDLESRNNVVYVAGWDGILISDDNGVSWDSTSIEGTSRIHDIFVTNDNGIYAGTHTGLYFSHNNGEDTWVQLSTIPIIEGVFVDSQNIIYLSQRFSGIYVSSDSGQTWIHPYESIPGNSFIENSEGRIFCSSINIIYSDDRGATWQSTELSLQVEEYFHATTGRIYAGTYNNGIYFSDDGGDTWTNDGLIHPVINSITQDANGAIYCVSNLYGIFSRSDEECEWIQVGTPFSFASIMSLCAVSDETIIAGAIYDVEFQGGGAFISHNGGIDWTTTSLTLKTISALAYDVESNMIFAGGWFGGGGMRRSNDFGDTWEIINTGLTSTVITSLNVYGDIVFAGTWDGLFWSNDGGDNWNSTSIDTGQIYSVIPFQDFYVAGVFNNNHSSSGAYASYDNGQNWESIGLNAIAVYDIVTTKSENLIAATDNGIFRSINSGYSWDLVFDNFGITSLVVQPDSTIYASSNNGILCSFDDGITWQSANGNISDTAIVTLINTESGKILAGTYSSGIFITNYATNNIHSGQLNLPDLLQIYNYPNPFNPSTTIRYGLPEDSNVSLVIYDVRGQVVQMLDSAHQSAGWYEVLWNGETSEGNAIATGIYFARLVAGDYTKVVKMLYLK